MLLVFRCTLEMLADVHRKGWVGRVGGCTVKRRMEADEKELKNNMKALTAEIGALRCDIPDIFCGCKKKNMSRKHNSRYITIYSAHS